MKPPRPGKGKKTKKAKPAAPQAQPEILDDDALPAGPEAGGGGPHLLTLARAGWEHGDWKGLLALDAAGAGTDPDRAKLALILAAAHSHAGEMDRAAELARQAVAWGASRNMTARVLLSAAQNSLARVAAALEEEALPQFEAAVRLVQPHADAPLLARSRRMRELAQMGLLPEAAAALEQELGLVRDTAALPDDADVRRLEGQLGMLRQVIATTLPAREPSPQGSRDPATFCQRAFDTYRSLPPERQANFVYLDVKSLPRTGLHFMRNSFESLLREHFSFCEWYTEPGCCRQMPCAVTGYATERRDIPLLRMMKSHDFDLIDPVYAPEGPIRRLVLLRDPLYLLTSWWSLQVLYLSDDLLKRHGIMKSKLNFSHGPHVVDSAYRIIDAEGEDIPVAPLHTWLEQKTPYILGFVSKWAEAAREHPQNCRIVQYRDTPEAVLQVLDHLGPCLPEDAHARIEAFRTGRNSIFKARQDPFHSKSQRIADFLRHEAESFRAAAEALCRQDRTGLLAEAAQRQT